MILLKTSLRAMMRHPWQVALSVVGVALGVAIVIAIDLANTSARRAFELSADGVTGRATHAIVASSLSNGSGFADSVYRYLLVERGVRPIAPVVEGNVAAAQVSSKAVNGRTFHVFGVDVFAERLFRAYLSNGQPSSTQEKTDKNSSDKLRATGGVNTTTLIAKPNTAVLAASTARDLGLKVGDSLRVTLGGTDKAVVIAGLLEPPDERSASALENILLTDIGTAQDLLSMPGRLSRIDFIIPATASEGQAVERIRAALPRGLEIERSKARPKRVGDMATAFDLNLTALSLLALIVGMFIIYNTMTFSVVQRRLHIGILRAIGVTRREVFALVVAESFAIGVVGTTLGILLGIVLGSGLVRLTTQTINDLYFTVSVRRLDVAPMLLAKGFVLGVCASVVAALAPAREATHAPPKAVLSRSVVETQLRAFIPRLTMFGVAAIVLGSAILLAPNSIFMARNNAASSPQTTTTNIIVSYAGLLPVLAGCAMLVPIVTVGVAAAVRPIMARLLGITGSMAARTVVASLSRTAIAIAALMVAVSATVGVGVMVQSFRGTVVEWLSTTLNADIYVSTPSLIARRADAPIDSALARDIQQTRGVGEFTTFRTVLVEVAAAGMTNAPQPASRLAQVMTVQMTPRAYKRFHFKNATSDVWQRFHGGEVVVSEAFAFHNGVDVGSVITLKTDAGARQFRIAGVYYEYASDLGIVFMPRETYNRFWADRSISGISIFAAAGDFEAGKDSRSAASDAAINDLTKRLQAVAAGRQQLSIRSNRALLAQSLDVFDRTFAITDVLRLLTIAVSFVGVLAALMALQLERTRELGVLRASGFTPAQIWGLVTLQTGLMGLIAGLLAIPVGLMLAYVLIFVINQRSFGWTLQFIASPEVVVQAVALAVLAAALAGLYPAWKMARTLPAVALREE